MKIIIVDSCNKCPYCKNKYTDNMNIYTGTTCEHESNKSGKRVYLGNHSDREHIHKMCPLDEKYGE